MCKPPELVQTFDTELGLARRNLVITHDIITAEKYGGIELAPAHIYPRTSKASAPPMSPARKGLENGRTAKHELDRPSSF